ncbi:MAG: hypothetical protein ACRDH1_04780 [Actinomycetota bacterium]
MALHHRSPVIVMDTMRFELTPPRKCGPPESPKHVPAFPLAWFMDSWNQECLLPVEDVLHDPSTVQGGSRFVNNPRGNYT